MSLENRLKTLFWDFDQITWRLVEGFLSPLILHVVQRTPWNVLSTCLYTGFVCCSQDPSLGTCLDRQSWIRLAAKICLPCVSDFSPWISQNLGLLWGSQELSYPAVCTPSFPWGRVRCQHPLKGWEPWCLWGCLAGGAKGTRHPRVEFVSSGHKPAGRALLALSFGQRTKKSQAGHTFTKWSNFALLLLHSVFFLGVLTVERGIYSSLWSVFVLQLQELLCWTVGGGGFSGWKLWLSLTTATTLFFHQNKRSLCALLWGVVGGERITIFLVIFPIIFFSFLLKKD